MSTTVNLCIRGLSDDRMSPLRGYLRLLGQRPAACQHVTFERLLNRASSVSAGNVIDLSRGDGCHRSHHRAMATAEIVAVHAPVERTRWQQRDREQQALRLKSRLSDLSSWSEGLISVDGCDTLSLGQRSRRLTSSFLPSYVRTTFPMVEQVIGSRRHKT